MTLSTVYIGFCLAAMFGQQPTRVATVMHTATSAVKAVTAHWFPQDIEFNESCVVEGCPALNNIRLCASDVDIKVLREITKIISNCMKGSICGIVIEPRPMPPLQLSMEEFFRGDEIEGIETLPPDSGYLYNISNIQLDISANENQRWPLQATLLIPNLRIYGRPQFDFQLATIFGPTLTTRLTQATFDIGIPFISTISVNKTVNGAQYDIQFVNPVLKARSLLCGLELPSGFPDVHSLLTSTSQNILENSFMAKSIGNFMRRLYQSAIQVVSNNCKQLKSTG